MKKILIMAMALVAVASTANAQLVKSRTFAEKKSSTVWFVRAGLSINNAAGAGVGEFKKEAESNYGSVSVGANCGYDVSVGFQKGIGQNGIYWGMELGVGTRGGKYKAEGGGEEEKAGILTHNVKYSPFTFGYKYSLTDDIQFDGHIGAYASYDFAGKAKTKWTGYDNSEDEETIGNIETFQSLDAGMQIGVGVWYKKLNFDITYQRGFIQAYEYYVYGSDDKGVTSSNLMLRVGFAF